MLEYIYVNFIDRSPVLIWGAFFAIGLLLERLLPAAIRKKNSKSSCINFEHSLIYLVIIFVINFQFISFMNRFIDSYNLGSLFKLESYADGSAIGFIFVTILSALLLDLFLYWWHRAEHTIPFLWDLHVVHHSDDNLNAFTSTRELWIENFIRVGSGIILMKLVLGVSSESVVVAASLFAGINFINHCNIKVDAGLFYRVIATPQFERIHHSIDDSHQNKNFAGVFSIWDSVFGTLYIPEKDEYPETGVKGLHIESKRYKHTLRDPGPSVFF
jgi:sterol desaturase/sphingolipid hydroxylase (fatty acid hydroxylase superfamily)